MSPFYTLPTGARSCYNHVVMAGLQVQQLNLSAMALLSRAEVDSDLQAFVEAEGEAELDVYRSVLRLPVFTYPSILHPYPYPQSMQLYISTNPRPFLYPFLCQ